MLDANPRLADLLNALSAKLDDQATARLNASEDVDKKTPKQIAAEFLQAEGLV